jgi:hypothetical protein
LRKYIREPANTPPISNILATLDCNPFVLAEHEKIADTQKMKVWRFIPLIWQGSRDGRPALEEHLKPCAVMGKVGKPNDYLLANPQRIPDHRFDMLDLL